MGHNEIVLVFLPIDPLMVNLGCSDNTVHMNSLVNNLCPVHELSGGLPPQVPVRSISLLISCLRKGLSLKSHREVINVHGRVFHLHFCISPSADLIVA